MGKTVIVDHRITKAEARANPPDVILGQRVYVRHGVLKKLDINTRYTLDIFAEAACGKCDNRPNRPNDLCDPCPNYHGTYKFHRDLRLRGTNTKYHALPMPDLGHIRSEIRNLPNYEDLNIQKILNIHKMHSPLKFMGKLFGENAVDSNGFPRANQEKIVAEWLKHKIGTIKAPPRTGKTVSAAYLTCTLGVKTVVMAHQYKILKQFYDTFMGNPAKGRAPMSDAPTHEKKNGLGTSIFLVKNIKQLLKFGDNPDDWPDVLLINYQKFPHKMARVQQFLNNNYSFKIIDEQHQGAANAYAKVLFAMTMPYSLGLSATPRRKDELDRKSMFTIGPVVAESQTISIPPIVETKLVNTTPDTQYKHWAFACRWSRNSADRNHEVLQEVFKDLAEGHDVIIVPVGSHVQQVYLVNAINERAKRWRKADPKAWGFLPYPLAIELQAKSNQDAVIDRVDDGRPCVLVAIQSMIKQAIDMERPSMVYLMEPFSATKAVGSPMFEQLSFRVATPSKRKPMEPVIKVWIDQIGSFRGALTGLWWNEIFPGSRKDATPEGPKYRLGPNTYAIMSGLRSKPAGKGGKGFSTKKHNAPSGGKWA